MILLFFFFSLILPIITASVFSWTMYGWHRRRMYTASFPLHSISMFSRSGHMYAACSVQREMTRFAFISFFFIWMLSYFYKLYSTKNLYKSNIIYRNVHCVNVVMDIFMIIMINKRWNMFCTTIIGVTVTTCGLGKG